MLQKRLKFVVYRSLFHSSLIHCFVFRKNLFFLKMALQTSFNILNLPLSERKQEKEIGIWRIKRKDEENGNPALVGY